MIINNIAYWRTTMNAGKGVSQAHLARNVGVSRSFVTKLEKSKSQPGAELMLRMAGYFNQPVGAIFKLTSGTDAVPAFISSDVIPSRQINRLTPSARPAGLEAAKDKSPVGPAAKVVASLSRSKPIGKK
ncbi:MAG: helix-turn-helix domain-containing protein [Verrucomicrobiota bacterium]|jgi:putative transcriptional regulator